MVNDWLAANMTVDDTTDTVSFLWDSNRTVDLVTFVVEEDGTVLQTYNSTSNAGTLAHVGDSNKHVYHLTVNVTNTDGQYYYAEKLVTINENMLNLMPGSYPNWLKQCIVIGATLMLMLLFSAWRTDMAAIAGFICMGAAYYFEIFPMSLTS